jgi:ATP-dependent DNA helicase 2 subunit 2
MDLSTFGRDEEGFVVILLAYILANYDPREPTEYMPIEDTFAPLVHRIKQAIQQRAINPTEPIGPPAEVLMKWSNPPEKLVSKAAPTLKRLQKAADVKKGIP